MRLKPLPRVLLWTGRLGYEGITIIVGAPGESIAHLHTMPAGSGFSWRVLRGLVG